MCDFLHLAYKNKVQLPKPWMSSFKQEKGAPAGAKGCRSPASPYVPAQCQHLGHQHFSVETSSVVTVFLLRIFRYP